MASWTLVSISGPKISNRTDYYGNFFSITFTLKYSGNQMGLGAFVEMPRLEWKETITMLEKNKKEWWTVDFDQYARNPASCTLRTCFTRYLLAYDWVVQGNSLVSLKDKNGGVIKKSTFKQGLTRGKAADCVRDYLKKNGGILEFTIMDSPAIVKPTDATVHKERILTFDCGIQGLGTRVVAFQHLIVDGNKPEADWHRECKTGLPPGYKISGLTKVAAPASVGENKALPNNAAEGNYL